MKMYIELVFILNFLLDLMILYGTKKILKRSTNNYRLIISSVFASTTTFFVYTNISEVQLIILKLLYSILIIIIAFGKKDFLKNITYFYLISILIGGTIYLVGLSSNYYLNLVILLSFTPIIIFIFININKKHHITIQEKYNVIITINNKKYNLEGYIDTGNQLYSPINNRPVILIDFEVPAKNIIYVPYKTLNSEGIIKCIKPDKVEINKEIFKKCLIGFTKNKINLSGCNCILPNCIKEII